MSREFDMALVMSCKDRSSDTPLDSGKHLASLAWQARAKAERAAVLIQFCEAAGDPRGAEHWHRLLLAHRRVLWAVTRSFDGGV
jgi:hypothetical protein